METEALELIELLDEIEKSRELTSHEKGVRDALTWAYDGNERPCDYLQ